MSGVEVRCPWCGHEAAAQVIWQYRGTDDSQKATAWPVVMSFQAHDCRDMEATE